jgi:virginiamycin B lyase
MFVRRCALSLALVSLVALSACGGHSAGLLPQSVAQSQAIAPDFGRDTMPDAAAIPVIFSFLTAPNPEPDGTGLQHQHFIAWNTKTVRVQVYKPGSTHNARNLLSTVLVKIGPAVATCKPSPGNTRTCTATLRLPPPSVDLVMTSWNLAPAGGKIPANAKQLAYGSVANQAVKTGTTVKVALGGIPKAFALTVPGSTIINNAQQVSMHGVAPATQKMNLVALDAVGNIILTDGYVTAAGKPVSIAMSVLASLPACGSAALANGAGTPAATIAVGAPPKSGIAFQYGVTAVATPFTKAGACYFVVRASLAGATNQYGRYVLLGPQITEYPITGPSIVQPVGITRGPDGNMWWTDFSFVGKINVSTKVMTQYSSLGSGQGIVTGPDKNLWITGYGTLTKMSTAGTVLNQYTWNASFDQPSQQIAVGPDGNFWFANAQSDNPVPRRQVIKVTPSGVVTAYNPLLSGAYLGGVAAGADGNMWFGAYLASSTSSASYVERMSTSGTNAVQYATTGSAQYPGFAVQGADKNVWFTSCGGQSINKITSAGVVTSFASSTSSSVTQPWGITTGPDGAIWFASLTGGSGKLMRIPTNATSASQITSFPVPSKGGVYWIATGPDGALWFTEWLNNGSGTRPGWIGRMTY